MIKVPTTLVLGAGASQPYGFPTGYELRVTLCNGSFAGGLQNQIPVDAAGAFSAAFLKSGMSSIDAFLARRGTHKIAPYDITYADVGKKAIAYSLIQREDPQHIHRFMEDHWYQYLWSFMSDSLESFGENKLRIITFNYDRSLEFYLLSAMQHSFGLTTPEAASHLKKIPILHVYGQLGELSEISSSGHSRSYSNDSNKANMVALAAKGIRVIDESRDDDEVFDLAYSYLEDAQKICFLGFGFDETNTRRLRINKLMHEIREHKNNEPQIYATTFGLESAERQRIINMLNPTHPRYGYNSAQPNIEPHSKLQTTQYLRATGVFIT